MQSVAMKCNETRCRDSYLSYVMMYGFYYASMALASALISVYMLDKGYKADQVSFVVSMSFLAAAVAQPFAGRLQDRYDSKVVNVWMLLGGGMGSIGVMLAKNIVSIALFYSLVMMMFYGANPLIERIATRSRHSYGKVRMWGTIGYSCGAQAAGWIYQYISPEALYFSCMIAFVACVFGLLGTVEQVPVEQVPENTERVRKTEKQKSHNQIRELMKNRFFIMYLVFTGIYYGVMNLINTYCAPMFQNDGFSVDIVSTILLFACFCELPLVLFSHKFMNRISNQMLLMVVTGMVVVQTLSYWMPVPLLCKILITFLTKHPSQMLLIMVNLKVIDTIVTEKQQIMALSLVFAVRNLSSVLFHLAAGEILMRYTYPVLFFWCFVIICAGLMEIFFFRVPDGNDRVLFH